MTSKNELTALDYSIVIKKHLDFLIITMPDLNITIIEDLPNNGKITDKYLLKVMSSIGSCWQKAQTKLLTNTILPQPSLIKNSIEKESTDSQSMEMTAPEAAKYIGCSENTIRRAVHSGKLKCKITPGGHRRILREDLNRFKLLFTNDVV